jgi:hypothetical protein
MTYDSRWETPDFKASRKILGDFALGFALGTATFTGNEISSMRISHKAQLPFLNSIQAGQTTRAISAQAPESYDGNLVTRRVAGNENLP